MDSDTDQILASDHLFFAAFRASFVTTFDCLLDDFLCDSADCSANGFFRHIPLLNGCSPQVQLQLLFETWQQIQVVPLNDLDIVHQCVCFCAFSELAGLSAADNRRALRRAVTGPGTADVVRQAIDADGHWLASRSRAAQVIFPFTAQAAVLDIAAATASEDLQPVRSAGGIGSEAVEYLESLAGRWRVPRSILEAAKGLLTETEQDILNAFFEENANLLSSDDVQDPSSD
jgi:hypothetical protein